MMVFYSSKSGYVFHGQYGTRCIDGTSWLSNAILPVDISYWAVPGTLED